MKVAVSSTGPDLDAQVDPRFGRAQYLLVVDIDSLEFEALENPNMAAGGGAGIQTAQMIAAKGAEAVITGNCGPNAYRTLAAAGIGVHVGASGTVRQAIEDFKSGKYQATTGPSVPGHFGMGGGPGAGRPTASFAAGAAAGAEANAGEAIQDLKQETEAMRAQLEGITERIARLEKP
jgi:predicted Fe-Mo cluster-binding NifX family protein